MQSDRWWGGLALSVVSWRALLVVNVPVAVAAWVSIRHGIRRDEPAELHSLPLDIPGALLGTGAVMLGVWSLTLGTQKGWTSGPFLSAAIGALALGATFVAVERRTEHPLLDLSLLARGSVAAGVLNQAALMLALGALGFTVALQLQLAWGWTPFEAALGRLPQVLTMLAMAPLVERIIKRLGMRRSGIVGGVVVLAAVVLYAMMSRHGYVWVAVFMVLSAAGMRVVMIASAISVMKGVPPERTTFGSALSDTGQEVGNSVGIAIAGTVIAAMVTAPMTGIHWSAGTAAAFEDSVTIAGLLVAVAAAVLVAGAAYLGRPSPPQGRRRVKA